MKCPKCNRELVDGTQYCDKCGAELEEKNCPSCGERIRLSDRFCSKCGRQLITEKEMPQQNKCTSKSFKLIVGCCLVASCLSIILWFRVIDQKSDSDIGLTEKNRAQEVSVLEEAIKNDPKNEDAYESLIILYADQGDAQGVIDTYRLAEKCIGGENQLYIRHSTISHLEKMIKEAIDTEEYDVAVNYCDFVQQIDVELAKKIRIQVSIMKASIGENVFLGHYEQDNNTTNGAEPIEWEVLSKENGKTLLVSKYALDRHVYNEGDKDVTWETCTLRTWLNYSFYYNVFDVSEQEIISMTSVNNPDSYAYYQSDYAFEVNSGKSKEVVKTWGANGGNETEDKIFLLNHEQALEYLATEESRRCIPTEYAKNRDVAVGGNGTVEWWLKSPGPSQSQAMLIWYEGQIRNRQVGYGYVAVRPALWVADFLPSDEDEKILKGQSYSDKNIYNGADEQQILSTESVMVGDYITFGHYEQDGNAENGTEPIEWKVLAKEDGKALLISKYALDSHMYNEKQEDVTWENCTLRDWLNNYFYRTAFIESEREQIVEVINDNPDSTGFFRNDSVSQKFEELMKAQGTSSIIDVKLWGVNGGNPTHDKVFLLSYVQAMDYFDSDMERMCTPTVYAINQGAFSSDGTISGECAWWIRSPGNAETDALIGYNFDYPWISSSVIYQQGAVRPALWIEGISDDKGKAIEDAERRAAVKERLIEERERAAVANASVGEYVTFGHYEQNNKIEDGMEPIEWQVLAKEDGKTLVISRYCLDVQPYNTEYVDVTWRECTLRNWLNSDFLGKAFDETERARIIEVTNENPDSYAFYDGHYVAYENDYVNQNYGNIVWGANGGNVTHDRVFLLNYGEALEYFDSDEERKCIATVYAKTNDTWTSFYNECCWWLRSSGYFQNNAMYVDYYEGKLNRDHISARGVMDGGADVTMKFAVRPAIWIMD